MMRLAISNIAWDAEEDESIAKLLNQYQIDAIDVAHSKYFADPVNVTHAEIARVKNWWDDRHIEITGMQALLFGTSGLNIFGEKSVQETMLGHLNSICRIGAGLGGTRLVFGSPKNRDRSGLSEQETLDKAVTFFRRLGDIAQVHDVIVCLEPNPSCYGANFMTTSAETAFVVEQVGHASIKMQLDTGALTINGEDPQETLHRFAHLIGHIHASEPDLLPLGDGATDHKNVYLALQKYLPSRLVSIEMVATKTEPHPVSIERAINKAIGCYRP